MKWLYAVLCVALFACGSLLSPIQSVSADSGLVTCGYTGGPNCDFCYFMKMVNNVITWLFGLLVLIAILLIVYAGFQLVVSAGNESAWTKAKEMLTNVIIGFVIVMSAWLIVDTVLKALINPNSEYSSFGMWNQIHDCGGSYLNNPS